MSAWWTWVLTTQGSLGSPMTTICSICWWGQLFVNGNFGPWHIHTPTEPSCQTQQCVKSKNLIDLWLRSQLQGKVEFTHQILRWSVFATNALPTSNSTLKRAPIGTQQFWSICFCICIQARIFICSCICIGQKLAFVFLPGDSNMISVFRTLSGLASLGIFLFIISHVNCNLIPLSCIIKNSGRRILCGLRRHQTNHISAGHVDFSQQSIAV